MVLHHRTILATALTAAAFIFTSCSSGAGNGSPRVQTVPAQSASGGTPYSLDLGDYVTDREGDSLVYTVVSGGGSFSGSVYTHTFDTMGTYTVQFQVQDSEEVTESSFVVTITTAKLAVVREDNAGLLLLDTDSEQLIRFAGNAVDPRLAATLSDGKVLYNVGAAATQDLWVFDPLTRESLELGSGHAGAVTYRTVTTDNVVMFTCGDNSDQDLYAYDATTGLVRAVAASVGELEENPFANGSGLVFFERGSGGQADIFYYDPSENETVAVSEDAAGETIQGVLADGGVVFSRLVSGFNELFYFRVGTGLTQIPTLGTAANANKVFATSTTSSDVVYTYLDSGAGGTSVGWWNVDGTEANTTSANTMSVFGTTANREIVILDTVSGSDSDISVVDITGTSVFALNTSDLVTFEAIGTDGTNSYLVYQTSGTPANLLIRDLTGASTAVLNDGAGLDFLAMLSNGDVVFQKSDQTNIRIYDVSAAGVSLNVTGTGLVYGGVGPDTGDIVYAAEVAAQTDLFFWDDSAVSATSVSSNTLDDTFAMTTRGGEILFTRLDADSAEQLQLFDPADSSTEALTDEDSVGLKHDHTVLGIFEVQ